MAFGMRNYRKFRFMCDRLYGDEGILVLWMKLKRKIMGLRVFCFFFFQQAKVIIEEEDSGDL